MLRKEKSISKMFCVKNILTVVIVTVVLLSLLPVIGTAQTGNAKVKFFQVKPSGFDQDVNSYIIHVNVSVNMPGNLTYIEEFYTVDSNRNPKFVSNTINNAGELVQEGSYYNASFEILRPVPHGGKTYSLVKSVVIVDNTRIYEYWLTRNKDFIDNTGTDDGDDALLTEAQNVDVYEKRDGVLVAGSPVLFEYNSLDAVYEINVTGKANGEAELRVELLKGRPGNTNTPRGIVYKYIDISADSNNVGEIAAKYRIENSWMKDRNISNRNVGLISWNGTGKKWNPMPTKIIDKDGYYTYYESVAQGLSSFAIVGYPFPKSSSRGNKTPVNTSGNVYSPNDADTNGTGIKHLVKNVPGFGFILTMIAFLLLFRRIKKDSKIENRKLKIGGSI